MRDLPPLPDNTEVWITTDREAIRGRVVSPASRLRSYVVETPSGRLQRNRNQLRVVPDQDESPESQESQETDQTPTGSNPPPKVIMTRSKTGTAICPPTRF